MNEGVGAYKIVILNPTSLKMGSLNRKFYVNIKNGLDLENPVTNESVGPYSRFLDTLYISTPSALILYSRTRIQLFQIKRFKS